MKRKVIQIANSTQLISLPRDWALRFNIKKGDELEVTEMGAQVTVSTSKGINIKKREIDVTKLHETTIKKLLYGLYNVGYEEVKVKFDSLDAVDIIQNVLRDEMIGYEIIEQRENYIIVKSIAGGFETEFDNMLRRAFILLKTMSQGILEAMEKEDVMILKSIRQLEANNNKYIAFCFRILAKRGYSDYEKTIFMYGVLNELEKAADHLKYLCDLLASDKLNIKNISKEQIAFFKGVDDYLDFAYNLFYNFNFENADKLFTRRKDLIKKGLDIIYSTNFSSPKTKMHDICHMRITVYGINFIQAIADMTSRRLETIL